MLTIRKIKALLFVCALLIAAPSRAKVPEGWVVFASNREDGRHEIYRMQTDGSDVTRLTFSGGKVPSFSPDGTWVLYHLPAEGSIHVMHPDGSEDHKVCDGTIISDDVPAFWLSDRNELVCVVPQGNDERYYLTDPVTGTQVLLFSKNDFTHLRNTRFEPGGITPDGRWLVGWAFGLYRGGYEGDNGVFDSPHSTVVLDTLDPERVYFFGPGCLSAIAPGGGWIYHVTRASPTVPDMARMNIADLMTRSSYEVVLALSDEEWGHMYMPSVSNDNRWLVHAASQGCHDWYACDFDIFLHRLGDADNARTRLTEHAANDNFPSIFISGTTEPAVDAGVDGGLGEDPATGCGCGGGGASGDLSWLLLALLALCLRGSRNGRHRRGIRISAL